MIEKIDAYECPQCGELYESSWDAEHCCETQTRSAYKCSICGDIFKKKDAAAKHHLNHKEAICSICGSDLKQDSYFSLYCANSTCPQFMRTFHDNTTTADRRISITSTKASEYQMKLPALHLNDAGRCAGDCAGR